MNTYTRWFSRVVWLGILLNLFFALPALFVPARVLEFLNLEPTVPTIWVRFSGQLLILLSLFYIPAASNPSHYRANAWLSVLSRLAGAVFFFSGIIIFAKPSTYLPFGVIDLLFALAQGWLLRCALRDEQ